MALILLSGLLLTAGCSHKSTAPPAPAESAAGPPPRVQVTTARVGDIAQILSVTGTLAAPRAGEATVSPPTSGTLDLLPVRFGQAVQKGQVVAHLSTLPLAGQIQQAQATVVQNQLQVEQARTNYLQQLAQTRGAIDQARTALLGAIATEKGAEATLAGNEAAVRTARQALARQETLLADGLIAKKDLEAAQLAVRSAESQAGAQRAVVAAQRQTVLGQRQTLAAARAATLQNDVKQNDIRVAEEQLRISEGALATLRNQLTLYTIRAPLTGVITVLGASVGETVDTTAKLMTISDLNTMELQLAMPAESAQKVHPGQNVEFRTDTLPGKTFTTKVHTVSAQVDPASDTIRALALVANPGHQLKDDVRVRASIVTERHAGAVLVPKSAVLFDASGKSSVTVIDKDQKAHPTDVTLGLTQGDTVEIISGLNKGGQIATTGSYGLPDGTKVEIDTGEKPAPPAGKGKEQP